MSGAVAALQVALAAEHAVVWGYAVVGAHVDAALQVRVREADRAHRARRDATAGLIRRYGADPTATEPAYQLPFPVTDRYSALRLAVHLEDGVGSAWRYVIEVGPAGSLRRQALSALTDAAVRAARWRVLVAPDAPSVPFPGT